MSTGTNKRKVFNDPIYGFITIPFPVIETLIEHPWFQRLRRIQQLGLTNLVYPGALHTRFHHALGAMHLMGEAIEVLRSKGIDINDEEAVAVTIAILLHDIGHGPYSHSLENSFVYNVTHEQLTELFMDGLNKEFDGELSLAIEIFKGRYHKQFLHQLVSSQLDMDRLDYLRRDSFYTGVQEGVINSDRIIKMLNVHEDELVIDSKGIYSIEKFIIARRLMYWQVYLHKAAVAAEHLLVNILRRARELTAKGEILFATDALREFISTEHGIDSFRKDTGILNLFSQLDDYDILCSIKAWSHHEDKILSTLSSNLINRRLYKIRIQNEPFDQAFIDEMTKKAQKLYEVTDSEIRYYVFSGITMNSAYDPTEAKINILYNNGTIADVTEASDQLNITALSQTVKKHFICFPKECVHSGINDIVN